MQNKSCTHICIEILLYDIMHYEASIIYKYHIYIILKYNNNHNGLPNSYTSSLAPSSRAKDVASCMHD
jgi:hypothetical protein